MGARKPDREEKPASEAAATTTARVPVVGIGASAGGLEAFEQFFLHAPANLGRAYVLMPHLAPNYKSMLAEILQRVTTMPVIEARDQMAVEPNHVYVPPPNHNMQMFHDKLQLSRLDDTPGLRMPIDLFLRSLAEDQQELATGIILSGTGTDGTLGLRAIHGAGGITMVQEPATAKYDGMPRSAIGSGFVTHVLAPEKMPLALEPGTPALLKPPRGAAGPISEAGLRQVLMQLRSATGNDFSLYKKSTIMRRIKRRMMKNLITRAEVYVNFLRQNPAEVDALFKELLINVTSFFRDPEAFALLRQEVLPRLCADKPADYVFRVWIAGCATGEEAYSIAMLLCELMEESGHHFKVQIYATDLDEDAIARARAGVFPANIAQDMSAERLERFFVAEDHHYRVKKEIRQLIVFAVQNVMKDPPFTRLDLLCCRNLMIYLEPELQKRLIPIFHYALKPGGVLFLSPAESIGGHAGLFMPINRKWKLYRASKTSAPMHAVISDHVAWTASQEDNMSDQTIKTARESKLAQLTRRLLVQCFAPASVLTDLKGEILFVHGETGKYLRPAPGQASLNVVEMAREEFKTDLRSAVNAAASKGVAIQKLAVPLKRNGKHGAAAELGVRLLTDPETNQNLLLISFQELSQSSAKPVPRGVAELAEADRMAELERELVFLKERHQANLEEEQATSEALKASNEELQSTNEELQSTNEELETSKEELQSVNEELITVNTELQAKLEQLASMQNDMKNLLDNVNVGIIFLDRHLMIRSFTREATRFYRLAPSDVGRPLNDIKSGVENYNLLTAAGKVLDTLIPWECEIELEGGAWSLARIQPYRTMDNMIDGVLITFTDITDRIRLGMAVQEALALAQGIVDSVHEPLLVLDAGMQVVAASGAFYRTFGVLPEETLQHPIRELGNGQWDIPAFRRLLEGVVSTDLPFENYVVEHDFPNIGHRRMLLNARRFIGKTRAPDLILLAIEIAP